MFLPGSVNEPINTKIVSNDKSKEAFILLKTIGFSLTIGQFACLIFSSCFNTLQLTSARVLSWRPLKSNGSSFIL